MEDVGGTETVPPHPAPGYSWDEDNAFVGEGEDLLVPPESNRQRNYPGSGGNGSGIDDRSSSSSLRRPGSGFGAGAGAGSGTTPPNGNVDVYRGPGTARAPANVNGYRRADSRAAAPININMNGNAGAPAAAATPVALTPGYVNGDAAGAGGTTSAKRKEEQEGVQRGSLVGGGSFEMATAGSQVMDKGIAQLELSPTAAKLKRVQVRVRGELAC